MLRLAAGNSLVKLWVYAKRSLLSLAFALADPYDNVAGRKAMRKLVYTTCLTAAAVFAVGAASANDELAKLQQDAKQWVMQAGDFANTRYSALKQITAENVGKLQVAWTFSTGVLRGHEGGPLVVGDMMYVHAPFPNTVFALNIKDENKIVWKYEPKQDPNVIPVMCCDTVNRGVAYADGKIFLHQADTTVVALDAKTGKVVWSVKNGDPSKGETGTSSPHVFKDKVIIGISGGEFRLITLALNNKASLSEVFPAPLCESKATFLKLVTSILGIRTP
jgi:glucose dehydrogenase